MGQGSSSINGAVQVSFGQFKYHLGSSSINGAVQVSMGQFKYQWGSSSTNGAVQVSMGQFKKCRTIVHDHVANNLNFFLLLFEVMVKPTNKINRY